MKVNGLRLFLIIIVFCTIPTAVLANDKLLDLLRDKGTISDEEYKELKDRDTDPFKIKFNNGVTIVSDDKNFKLKIGGRLFFDAAFYDIDQAELGDGTEVRRAYIALSGSIFRDWKFTSQYDFADPEGAVDVKSAYISYEGLDLITFSLGQFKEFFSLEETTSSKYITFMERALPTTFAPGRNIGIGFQSKIDKMSIGAGVFSESASDESKDDEGFGTSGRITVAPIDQKDKVLHLGISGMYRTPEDENNRIRFRERPETHTTNVRLVTTDQITNVDDYYIVGLEGAIVFNQLSLQGEYIHTFVSRGTDLSNLEFDGAYINASWFLTGEQRNYKAKSGLFGRISPKNPVGDGGLGAWEVAVRYSEIDLNDKDVRGGEENNITFGVNWYLNSQLRFMANCIIVDSKKENVDDDPKIFQLRAQIDF